MRTARAQGMSANALAKQYRVHRGTVWAKTRERPSADCAGAESRERLDKRSQLPFL